MDAVAVLRELWLHRVLVALGAMIAIMVGILIAFRVGFPPSLESRSYNVGIASTTALVDTPASQVVDLGDSTDTNTAGALPGRAALLASLLTTSPLKDEIAKRAGVPLGTLLAGTPDGAATTGAAGPTPGASIGPNDRRANILTVGNAEALPILTVEAQSADVYTAARLSNEAIAVLKEHLDSLAGTEGVPTTRRLVIKQLGEARVATLQKGPSRMLAAAATIFIFGLLCMAIVLASLFARKWREVVYLERRGPQPFDDLPADPDLRVITPTLHLAGSNATTQARQQADVPKPPSAADQGRWDVG